MAKSKKLKVIKALKITIFKLKNRNGFAALCLNNLTEGRTAKQAFHRLNHPLRRLGYTLPAAPPKPKKSI